jgi:hypothetical protein
MVAENLAFSCGKLLVVGRIFMAKKKTAAEVAAGAATTETAVAPKRGRGRPKKAAAKAAPKAAAVKRGPGRPKGSKNKKGAATKASARKAPAAKPATGRRRGRPAAGLAGRIDKMIRELEALRAQVRQLEQLRSALQNIKQF